jgi:DNA processing protein
MIFPETKKYWVAFSQIECLGPQKLKRLCEYFPDMQTAWRACFGELMRAGLTAKDVEMIITQRNTINPDQTWEELLHHDISVITIKDKNYPKLLREIYSPPGLLYVKGTIPDNYDFAVAVVGTRKITNYGRQITPEIVRELAGIGIVIISGLALGVDALAHQSCLEAGGQTIAVLGCGLDTVYPITNRRLAEEISRHGAVISEYPLGSQPLKQHFPCRNRIISGLSRGVVVIEGNEDSGSLITAKCALEQNREVMAVPGNINNQTSKGPNKLIKMGASVVTSATDVLESLDLNLVKQFTVNKKILPATAEEEELLKFLSAEPTHIDEIIQKSKLNTSIANAALTMMEMKGMVRHLGGGNYVLSH